MTAVDLRGVPAALFGSAAGTRRRLEEWDAAIRGPLGAPRRVGVVSWESGVGATSVAAQLVRTVARRRDGRVLAVDIAGARAGLAALRGGAVTPPNATRANARTSADATTGLPEGPDGERIFFPAIAPERAAEAWLDDVAPITRFFDVTITDFGTRDPRTDFAVVAALSDVVCVVAAADRASAELARSLAAGVAELPEHPRVALALVDTSARSRRTATDAVGSHAAFPVVRIPSDRGLATGGPPRTLAARRALLALAAGVVGAHGVGTPGIGKEAVA